MSRSKRGAGESLRSTAPPDFAKLRPTSAESRIIPALRDADGPALLRPAQGVVKEIADICCEGRLAATLEGGYNLEAQAEAVVAEIKAFQGVVPDVSGVDLSIAGRIEEVKKVQSAYWNCFG